MRNAARARLTARQRRALRQLARLPKPTGLPLRLFENRKRQISIPSMRRHDSLSAFERALQSFYGEKELRAVPGKNPGELPRWLGRGDEFAAYWAEFQKIGPEANTSAPAPSSARSVLAMFGR